MTVVTISSPLTACEALPLKRAAIGAARIARESGETAMAERLMKRAREYNRPVSREHARRCKALGKGVEFTPTPALPVPAVKDMRTLKAAEVQEPVKLIVRELARMGWLSEWTIVGSANADGEEFQPLCARKSGNSVRYMVPKTAAETEAPAVAVEPDKKRRAPRKAKKSEAAA